MLCIITPSAIIKVRTTCCCSLRLQKQTAISRSDVANGWAGYCDTIIERRREFHVKSQWRSSWPFNAMKLCCRMHLSCESGFRIDPQPEAFEKLLAERRPAARRHNAARQDDISIAQDSHNTADQFLDHTRLHCLLCHHRDVIQHWSEPCHRGGSRPLA